MDPNLVESFQPDPADSGQTHNCLERGLTDWREKLLESSEDSELSSFLWRELAFDVSGEDLEDPLNQAVIVVDEMAGDEENPDNIQGEEALRLALRNARRERDERVQLGQNQQQGNRGVLLKMEPPSLDDVESFELWKKKLRLWMGAVKNTWTDNQMAAAVMALIHDKHKIKKNLCTTMLNTMTNEQCDSPTMKQVLDFLEEQLGKEEQVDIYETFKDFFKCEIKSGELYTDFTTRWDNAYQTLTKKDTDIVIPGKMLSLMLREAAKLPETALMNLRAKLDFNSANVYKETIKAINQICSGQTNIAPKIAQVKLCTDSGEHNVKYEEGCFTVDGMEMITREEHQVLLAERPPRKGVRGGGRGHGRGGGRGRGRGPDTGEQTSDAGFSEGQDPKEASKKCYNCGKLGHIAAKCRKQTEEGHWTQHEYWVADGNEINLDDVTEEELEETTELQHGWRNPVVLEEDDVVDEVFIARSRDKIRTFTSEARGAGGLDTCCSRTIMGLEWFEDYCKLLSDKDRKELVGPIDSTVNFLFGDGGKLKSRGKYYIPVEMHGYKAKIAAELVDSDIPLLLSKGTMSRAAMVLDLANVTTTVFGVTRRMKETTLGHPIISLLPVSHKPFAEEILVTETETMWDIKPLEEMRPEVYLTQLKRNAANIPEKKQREMIRKVHAQAGHMSKEKLMYFLKQSSVEWNMKVMKEELERIAKTCEGCILRRNTPPRPVACIPVADGFNQCVGVDLKINGQDGTIVLYVIDMWSKLIQARFVPSKKSEHIVAALLECWLSVYGSFDRSIHDNGGEFTGAAFKEMCDLMGVQDGTSGAHSPWSCGVVEIHHAIVDRTYEALRRDFPHYKKETLLQWAVMVKNSTPSATGFSPFQAVYGKNPQLPSLLTSNIAGMREEVTTKEIMESMNALNAARVRFNEALCDNRLSKMIKAKVRRNQTVFKIGDKVFWRSPKSIEKWRQGKVVAVDGKVMWLTVRDGSFLNRVSTDMAVKAGEEFDKTGKLVVADEEEKAELQSRPPRRPKWSIDEEGDYCRAERRTSPRTEPPPPPPPSPPGRPAAERPQPPTPAAQRPGQRTEDNSPAPPASSSGAYDGHQQQGLVLPKVGGALPQVSLSNSRLATNSPVSEVTTSDSPHHSLDSSDTAMDSSDTAGTSDAQNPAVTSFSRPPVTPPQAQSQRREATTEDNSPAPPSSSSGTNDGHQQQGLVLSRTGGASPQVGPVDNGSAANSPVFEDAVTVDREAEGVMVRTETEEQGRRYNTRKRGHDQTLHSVKPTKTRKPSEPRSAGKPASTGPKLRLSVGDTIWHQGQQCVVLQKMKQSGLHYNYVNLKPEEGKAYQADLQRTEFTRVEKDEQGQQVLITSTEQQDEVNMAIIPYNQHGSVECIKAKKEEIAKIVEQFDVVEEVEDTGQFRISCRFVLWYKRHSDGTVKTRARLVARGYEELDDIPSDSPTLDQTNMKVILALAQANNFKVVSADVKSAFLQGLPLTERTVVVKPPPEAGVRGGKLWRLKVSLYGLDDASLRFHWKVKQVFLKLSLRQSRYDPALFFAHDKDGKLIGIIGTHVDDFLIVGSQEWIDNMLAKIKVHFLLGTVEEKNFVYCGHRIIQQGSRLTLDQRDFAKEVPSLVISPERKKQNSQPVTDIERKEIRAAAGKLGWLARTTRPDLNQAQVEASSHVSKATVEDLKAVQKALARIHNHDSVLEVPKLPSDISSWTMELYTDASWQNLRDGGSTAGRVIFLSGGGRSFPVFWATNRIRRVCYSSQTAEIMALNTGLGEAMFVKEMIKEVTGSQVTVQAYIDNANAHNAIISNVAPTDKKVRLEAASVREALSTKELEGIKLVKGSNMFADPLTKKRADCTNLLQVVQTGVGLAQLGH